MPDLGYTVDAAVMERPGIELHLLLLHKCETYVFMLKMCSFLSYFYRFYYLVEHLKKLDVYLLQTY